MLVGRSLRQRRRERPSGCTSTSCPPGTTRTDFRVRVRDLPARTVAYIRVRNPYRGDAVAKAAERLVTWAERHALADGQWLGYQWDNPEIAHLDDCQYHVAVEAERFTPKGEIGRFRFPPMVVAQVEVRGGLDLELRTPMALWYLAPKERVRSR